MKAGGLAHQITYAWQGIEPLGRIRSVGLAHQITERVARERVGALRRAGNEHMAISCLCACACKNNREREIVAGGKQAQTTPGGGREGAV